MAHYGSILSPVATHPNSQAAQWQNLILEGNEVTVVAPAKMRELVLRYRKGLPEELRENLKFEEGGWDWSNDPETVKRIADLRYGTGTTPGDNEAFNVEMFRILARQGEWFMPDIKRLHEQKKFDRMLLDPAVPAWVAEGIEVPSATIDNGLGPIIWRLHKDVMRPVINEGRARWGLPPEPEDRPAGWSPLLTPIRRDLFLEGVPDVRDFQPIAGATSDRPLPEGAFQSGLPKVYVMNGNTGNAVLAGVETRFKDAIRDANIKTIQALSELPVDALVSVGRGNEEFFQQFAGPNVTIAGFVNQVKALEEADIFGTHGGMGGAREAQMAGDLALAMMSNFADQPENCARLVELGWGVQLDASTCTVEDVKRAYTELVENRERYAANLNRFRGGYEQLPPAMQALHDFFDNPGGDPGGAAPGGPGQGPAGPAGDTPTDAPFRGAVILRGKVIESSVEEPSGRTADPEPAPDSTPAERPTEEPDGPADSEAARPAKLEERAEAEPTSPEAKPAGQAESVEAAETQPAELAEPTEAPEAEPAEPTEAPEAQPAEPTEVPEAQPVEPVEAPEAQPAEEPTAEADGPAEAHAVDPKFPVEPTEDGPVDDLRESPADSPEQAAPEAEAFKLEPKPLSPADPPAEPEEEPGDAPADPPAAPTEKPSTGAAERPAEAEAERKPEPKPAPKPTKRPDQEGKKRVRQFRRCF